MSMHSFFRRNALIGVTEILCRLPLVFTVGYLAHSIGVERFGNWAVVLAFQVFVARVAGLGLSASISRFVPALRSYEAVAYLKYAVLLCLASVMASGILVVVLKNPIGKALGVEANFYWLLPVAVLLAAGSIADGLVDAFLKGRMAILRQISFVLCRTLIEIVAVLGVFMFKLSLSGEPGMQLATYACVVVACKFAIYPSLIFGMGNGSWSPPADQRSAFVNYGLIMVPSSLAALFISQSDRLVLSHFVTKYELGVYAFGATIAGYMVFLAYAVYPLLLSGASQLHDARNMSGVKTLFRESLKLFMAIWAGCMICLCLWAHNIVLWTGGKDFVGARNVLMILSFAIGLEYLLGIYQYVFHLVKRPGDTLWLNLAHAAMVIGAVALSGATSGIAYTPWAVLAVALTFGVLRYLLALRHMSLPMPNAIVYQVVALGAVTVLLAHYASNMSDIVRAAVTVAIMAVLSAYMLRRTNPPDVAPA